MRKMPSRTSSSPQKDDREVHHVSKFCLNCAAENRDNVERCAECGHPLQITPAERRRGIAFLLNEFESLHKRNVLSGYLHGLLKRLYLEELYPPPAPKQPQVEEAAPVPLGIYRRVERATARGAAGRRHPAATHRTRRARLARRAAGEPPSLPWRLPGRHRGARIRRLLEGVDNRRRQDGTPLRLHPRLPRDRRPLLQVPARAPGRRHLLRRRRANGAAELCRRLRLLPLERQSGPDGPCGLPAPLPAPFSTARSPCSASAAGTRSRRRRR